MVEITLTIDILCLDYLYYKKMLLVTRGQYQKLAESHGFAVTSMEDKDVPGLCVDSVDVLIAFFVGLMRGELDLEAIGEQNIKNCREKYNDDLCREAEHLQATLVLHVVLTKP